MLRSWMKMTVKITISKTISRGLNEFDPRPILLKTIGRGSNLFKPRPVVSDLSWLEGQPLRKYGAQQHSAKAWLQGHGKSEKGPRRHFIFTF